MPLEEGIVDPQFAHDFLWIDPLSGEDHATNVHHSWSRLKLMHLLRETDGYLRLLGAMTRAAGLGDPLIQVDLAYITGDEGRIDVAIRAVMYALKQLDWEPVHRVVLDYLAVELKSPYACLFVELIQDWYFTLRAGVERTQLKLERYYTYEDPPAPALKWEGETRPGESDLQLEERIKQESKALADKVREHRKAHTLPTGYRRSRDEVELDTEWYFRRHVLGEKIERILRFDINGKKKKHPHSRRAFYNAIADVERWLGATLYTLDLPDGADENGKIIVK